MTPPDKFDFAGLEPDILELFTRQIIAMAPALEAAILAKKAEFAQEYGGQRYFVPKGTGQGKARTPAQYSAVYQDGLTGMTTPEVLQKHKISKATLYRVMKKGGGRFG
jgi:Mor family transcriptional regulator